MLNNNLKFAAYVRKSSEQEDRQVASIDSQKRELSELAQREKINVAIVFEEAHSAKLQGRPVFNELLALVRAGKVNAILAWHPNRLSRNIADLAALDELMRTGKLLQIRTLSQTFNNNVPMELFFLLFNIGQAKLENENKGIDVRRGLRTQAEAGVYPAPAPIGYLNDKNTTKGKRKIIRDPERFATIRKMFELMLTGTYSPPKILELAHGWGLRNTDGKKISRSNAYYIFNNPFYYGEFEYPRGSGKWYTGVHEPMITRDEFVAIQHLLGRKGNPRAKEHSFAFRGPLRCGECGAMITAERKTKRPNKEGKVHTYIYYHCTKRKNPNCTQQAIEEKELEQQISEQLAKIEIPAEFREWAIVHFKEINKKEQSSRDGNIAKYRKEYDYCVESLDKLLDLRIKREIDSEEFARKKAVITKEKDRWQQMMGSTNERINHWVDTAEKYLNFAERAREHFANGTQEVKGEILQCLGSNYVLKDKKLSISVLDGLKSLEAAKNEANAILRRLEPRESVDNAGILGQMFANNSALLPG